MQLHSPETAGIDHNREATRCQQLYDGLDYGLNVHAGEKHVTSDHELIWALYRDSAH